MEKIGLVRKGTLSQIFSGNLSPVSHTKVNSFIIYTIYLIYTNKEAMYLNFIKNTYLMYIEVI